MRAKNNSKPNYPVIFNQAQLGVQMDHIAGVTEKIIGINQESPWIIQKRKEAIERLGTKWLLHPANHKPRVSSLGKTDDRILQHSTL
jgi:hypothetical protein